VPSDYKEVNMDGKHSIPPRSRQANRDMVDLTAYYTASLDADWLGVPGASLASLPSSVQVFARAAFDVRGIVQVASEGASTIRRPSRGSTSTAKD
jgi:hypothetical protein